MTNCRFENLQYLRVENDHGSINGKIDIIAPRLFSFFTDLIMESINFTRFQSPFIGYIYLKGVVFEIIQGDIKELGVLNIEHSFGKLSFTREPDFLHSLSIPPLDTIPKNSMPAIARLKKINSGDISDEELRS